jgi:hypothetical protein
MDPTTMITFVEMYSRHKFLIIDVSDYVMLGKGVCVHHLFTLVGLFTLISSS